MINIKVYSKKKQNSGGGSTSTTSTTSISSSDVNISDWFYFDPDTQSVVCKYQLMAVGDIIGLKNTEEEQQEP